MILQSLCNLHKRLSANPANGLPPENFSVQEITFKIVLLPDGRAEILDFRKPTTWLRNGKEIEILKPRPMILPGDARATEASFEPCFLWDDTRFVLGWHGQKNDPKRNKKCLEAFIDLHTKAEKEIADPDFTVVCNFLKQWKSTDATRYPDLLKLKKGRMVFQISGKTEFVHDNPRIIEWFTKRENDKLVRAETAQCLVTGEENQAIARLHPGIKKFPGSPYTGASLVSFNDSAYESRGKEGKDVGRGTNAPTSISSANAYSMVLDWLLSENQRQRTFKLVDTIAVFWTSESTAAENQLPWMLAGPPDTEDEETKKRMRSVLSRISLGTLGQDELGAATANYFLLGMSLNQGRISVRFWNTGTLGEIINNLKLHLSQLEIVRQWNESNSKRPDPVAPFAKEILRESLPLKDGRRDDSKMQPLLAGALMRSILTGLRYPDALAIGIMNRIRIIEKNPKGEGTLDHVTYLRAAILKAWLMRNHTEWLNQQNINMTTALDTNNTSIAYQLGRLFAVYEQAQRAAHDFKLERTIRETMFSSACATPLAVFVRLDKLNKHHLTKLKKGSKLYLSSMIDEIHQKVHADAPLPSALDLKGQSLFCIGYYHQRHDLRLKPTNTELQTA